MYPKKILFLCHGYKPATNLGGPIMSVSALAEAINNNQNLYSVDVLCTTDNLNCFLDKKDLAENINNVNVFYFNSISYFFWKVLGKKFKDRYFSISLLCYLLFNARYYSLIHIHIPLSFLGVWGCLVSRMYNIPFFYHTRGCYSEGRLSGIGLFKRCWIKVVENIICKTANRVIALTEVERNQILSIQPNSNTYILPNGLDSKPFNTFLEDNHEFMFDNEYILFLGRLDKAKGLDYLLESFSNVADTVDYDLVIAGPDHANYKSHILHSQRFNTLIDRKRIKFIGSVKSKEKLLLLNNAKAFFLPSVGEGFSIAILESFFLKCPVFATRECNITEAFECDAAIEIFRDVSKIESSLLYLFKNYESVRVIGARGREYVQKFEIKHIIPKYISLVENYVSK